MLECDPFAFLPVDDMTMKSQSVSHKQPEPVEIRKGQGWAGIAAVSEEPARMAETKVPGAKPLHNPKKHWRFR